MPLLAPTESEAAVPMAATPPVARAYCARDPSESALVTLLRDHLDAFTAAADRDDPTWRLPAFVECQLRAIFRCGDLTYRFVRLECTACRGPRVVPYSCKGRLCPSCAGRRMSEQAAHRVDRVLPKTLYRQFVLTLPGELACVVAFDTTLATAVSGPSRTRSRAGKVLSRELRASNAPKQVSSSRTSDLRTEPGSFHTPYPRARGRLL